MKVADETVGREHLELLVACVLRLRVTVEFSNFKVQECGGFFSRQLNLCC